MERKAERQGFVRRTIDPFKNRRIRAAWEEFHRDAEAQRQSGSVSTKSGDGLPPDFQLPSDKRLRFVTVEFRPKKSEE